MPQDMGPGVQPQPGKLRRAHTANLAQGEPQAISGPKPEKARPRAGGAVGAQPRPHTLKAGGQPGRCPASSRSLQGARTAATKASTARVARPLALPCSVGGLGARY